MLTMKQLTPVRLIKNKFFDDVAQAEQRGATPDELRELLGRGRAKKGIFEGDLENGELEIGQVAASIKQIRPAADLVKELWREYQHVKKQLAVS
jgi:enoyl-[acyl-carrier protein] reductase II